MANLLWSSEGLYAKLPFGYVDRDNITMFFEHSGQQKHESDLIASGSQRLAYAFPGKYYKGSPEKVDLKVGHAVLTQVLDHIQESQGYDVRPSRPFGNNSALFVTWCVVVHALLSCLVIFRS